MRKQAFENLKKKLAQREKELMQYQIPQMAGTSVSITGTPFHPMDLLSAFMAPAEGMVAEHPQTCKAASKNNVPNVKEVTMNTNAPNAELVKREHLLNSLSAAFYPKEMELQKHFGLVDDDRPKTFKEFLERLKAGKYVQVKRNHLDDEYDYEDDEDDFNPYNPMSNLRWRDPKVKEDKAGFDKARESLRAALSKLNRQVMIVDLDKALDMVEKFEEKKFH